MKNIAEQIAAFEAKRAALSQAMETIMSKAAEEGTTLDADEKDEYDGHVKDIEAIDDHLKRLRALEKTQKSVPVADVKSVEDGAVSRSGQRVVVNEPKLAPGVRFARVARCRVLAKLDGRDVREIAREYYPNDGLVERSVIKAAVPAASTDHATWASPLVGDETSAFADFVEYLRPMTILGKFGSGGIPSLRRVPFRVALISQTSGGAGYWVGEGAAKPLTSFDFSRTTLEPLKVANIAVATEETIRDSSPSAEMIIRDQLAEALRFRMDTDFIDPGKAASAGVSPASITNGLTAGTTLLDSTGRAEANIRDDVRAMMNAFINANNPPSTGVWIMSAQTALSLSLVVNALGQEAFNGIGMNGGTFFGLPVITSEYVGNYASSPADYTNSYVWLVNTSDIYFADEGGVNVDMSREASLEMADTSVQSSVSPPTAGAGAVVSLWQTNSVGFRAERTLNWARRRTTSVVGLRKVQWGQGLAS